MNDLKDKYVEDVDDRSGKEKQKNYTIGAVSHKLKSPCLTFYKGAKELIVT